ncbi:hypothetical protein HS088_TW13G01243 [Tripterygium wilfordii]|uniref:Uncharacterized protein n=1 Tax=Tripterygium wilfordii TaxID=458696 RepID=A0A7J7CW43_TRIWF|nr:hypothetical protein HS088_TW13G01243 [Tripterygium wilfordii]
MPPLHEILEQAWGRELQIMFSVLEGIRRIADLLFWVVKELDFRTKNQILISIGVFISSKNIPDHGLQAWKACLSTFFYMAQESTLCIKTFQIMDAANDWKARRNFSIKIQLQISCLRS